MIKMPVKDQVKSKGMIAGYGLIAFGGYLIYSGSHDFGYAMLLNGFGMIGIRDAG